MCVCVCVCVILMYIKLLRQLQDWLFRCVSAVDSCADPFIIIHKHTSPKSSHEHGRELYEINMVQCVGHLPWWSCFRSQVFTMTDRGVRYHRMFRFALAHKFSWSDHDNTCCRIQGFFFFLFLPPFHFSLQVRLVLVYNCS